MKREIRECVTVGGVQCTRITTADERWYARQVSKDGTEGNLKWEYVPSVTWIVDTGYPKGIGFMKWWADKGWSEGERIKIAAGEKGSKVHQACWRLVDGGTLGLHDQFENPTTLQPEELTPHEYYSAMTFADWWDQEKPQVIANERTVWGEGKLRYAGTEDLVCRIKSTDYRYIHVIDLKTSKYVWPSMEMQVSAYKHADTSLPRNKKGAVTGVRLGILQVGYMANKKKHFKYTEVPDRFPEFRAAYAIWKYEAGSAVPCQRDYPMEIRL